MEDNYLLEIKKIDEGLFHRTTRTYGNHEVTELIEIGDHCFITIEKDKFSIHFPGNKTNNLSN